MNDIYIVIITFNKAKEGFIARKNDPNSKREFEYLLKGITTFNTVLAELYHFLVNTVSSISSVQQLTEIDDSYTPKFIEVTKEQVAKLAEMLQSLSTLRGLINNSTRNYVSRQEEYFNIEKEVSAFLKSIEKKNISKKRI